MKHLIVGHDWDDSYNRSLLEHYRRALESRGHEVTVHIPRAEELGGLVLSREEHRGTLAGEYSEAIREEHALLEEAEAVTLVFPMWWVSPPATMKGWLDRALSYGFAYSYDQQGRPLGGLEGKKAATIVTCGSPDAKYDADGTYQALGRMWNDHVFRICGMEPVGNVWLGSSLFGGDEERAHHRERIEALAAKF